MRLKFLVPVLMAGVVCAQQATPEPGETEKALRERVRQFYQLQVEKKYRQAEAYIAADTKDLFYASGKPDIPGFSIAKVVMLEGGTKAEVTVKAKVPIFVMGQGMVPMELPTTGTWKIEDGQWVWYVDQASAPKTPFGEMKGSAGSPVDAGSTDVASRIKNFDVNSLRNGVAIDTQAVELDSDHPVRYAIVTNNMPGQVNLEVMSSTAQGVTVELEKKQLNAGEKTRVVFTRKEDGGRTGLATVSVSNLGLILEVHVTAR